MSSDIVVMCDCYIKLCITNFLSDVISVTPSSYWTIFLKVKSITSLTAVACKMYNDFSMYMYVCAFSK